MIQAESLTKFFGSRAAVRDLSFTIEPGIVVGFLGLNGAGKTTTLRILAGDLAPSSGTVRIFGSDLARDPRALKRRIGFLPDLPPLYPEMRVRDYLRYAGAIRGMRGADLSARLREVERIVQIQGVAGDTVGQLSHGFRQRLGIGQAIIHRPDLVILDEPIGGLDPVQIAEMRDLVRSIAREHTVVLSSHILPEISQTCDRILVMGDGRIIADGTEANLTSDLASGNVIEAVVRGTADAVRPVLLALAGVRDAEVEPAGEAGVVRALIRADGDVREAAARAIVERGLGLLALRLVEQELEAIFLQLTKGAAGPGPSPAVEA